MRKTILCTAFLGTTILAAGLGATSAGRADHDGGPRGPLARLFMAQRGRMMTLKAELNLTIEQRDAIKATVMSHKQELADAIKPIVEAKRELREVVLAEKSDDAAIRKAADALGKKVGDAAVVIAKVKVEAADKAKLTPEQLKKIADFRAASDSAVDEAIANFGAK